jgi:hypothetical protein
MTQSSLEPVTLIIECRERLVRMEEKLDRSADHEPRITALEAEAASIKTSFRTLQWVGASILTVVTVFGDSIAKLFT